MLAGQLQDGVYALITELKTTFFKSKGYFIIFLFVQMSRRGHINCSEPKGNYVTDINELCYRRPSSWRGGGILSYLLLVCISSIIELNKKTSCKGK